MKERKRIIALAGLAGSGKDTVAGLLARYMPITRMSFADPLKRFAMEVFDFSEEQVYGPSETRNQPDPRWHRPGGAPLTPRYALQTLGTEWGRNCDPSVWARLGARRAAVALTKYPGTTIVFTDCRFINEAEAINDVGGEVWYVSRGGVPVLKGAAANHPSETEMLSPQFQLEVGCVLLNPPGLSNLEKRVEWYAKTYLESHRAGTKPE